MPQHACTAVQGPGLYSSTAPSTPISVTVTSELTTSAAVGGHTVSAVGAVLGAHSIRPPWGCVVCPAVGRSRRSRALKRAVQLLCSWSAASIWALRLRIRSWILSCVCLRLRAPEVGGAGVPSKLRATEEVAVEWARGTKKRSGTLASLNGEC